MALQATLEAQPAAALPAALSFEAFYDAHVDAVWRTVTRLGVDVMHVEDAVQEVFVTAWRRQTDFGGRSSVKTWLTGIAINVASHHRRALARRPRPEALDDQLPAAGPGPEASAQTREGLKQLQRVLDQLSDEQREVFVMMEMEGLSAPEASAAIGAPTNTIYSRLRLARAAFNAAVAQLNRTSR